MSTDADPRRPDPLAPPVGDAGETGGTEGREPATPQEWPEELWAGEPALTAMSPDLPAATRAAVPDPAHAAPEHLFFDRFADTAQASAQPVAARTASPSQVVANPDPQMGSWPPPDPSQVTPAAESWEHVAADQAAAGAAVQSGWVPFEQAVPPQSSSPGAPVRQGGGRGQIVALAVLAGLVAGLLAGYGGAWLRERVAAGSTTTGALEQLPQSSDEAPPLQQGSVAAIADAALPTVVSISAASSGGTGTGSGFVLRRDGYIVTNNHVISGSDRIQVRFSDGTQARATVVGRSASYDLGVLKVNRNNLEPAPLGNSAAVRVGDPVIAIGSPLGLNGTVTTGIISSLDRPVTTGGEDEQSFISALQTDAAINPGNSGGPLLDAQGRVIGINSAIATVASSSPFAREEAGSIGLGFAIPINQAKRISEEIIASGESRTPIIGVSLDPDYTGSGAKVEEITSGGPAEKTDLKVGDVITELDGRPVADALELIVAIRSRAPGEEVKVGLENGKQITIELGVEPKS